MKMSKESFVIALWIVTFLFPKVHLKAINLRMTMGHNISQPTVQSHRQVGFISCSVDATLHCGK